MALQIFPKESAAKADQNAKALIEHLQDKEYELGLESAVLFYNFPLFREDENLLVADLVLASPLHGVILLATVSGEQLDAAELTGITSKLDGAFSQVFARLVKFARLRKSRTQLLFPMEAYIWALEGNADSEITKIGFPSIDDSLNSIRLPTALSEEVFGELVSVLDGSKALIRPKERKIEGFPETSRIAIVARLEEEIRRFDRDQRVAYMTEVGGTQRIRGLAGSGKTVVLALKAAMTAIRYPEATIAVTFYTKSLYQHIKQLITRFYRMHEDRDPDWKRLRVLHAWGGATVEGLYYFAAKRFGHQPLSFSQAQALSPRQPFGKACELLLEDQAVGPIFDYVFVDEAQDFPPEFMRLALKLATEERLVIAYDVFQTIFDVEVPTAASLFGTDKRNEPAISFEEDIILHKCYRNPREILLCAHAIGFGIYGKKIAQMLESKEHWEDFGYEVVNGDLSPGQPVSINRPTENSPSTISLSNNINQIIGVKSCSGAADEALYVAEKIKNDIQEEGISPEDILVICADDRNATGYFNLIARELRKFDIRVNNLQEDSYSLRDFHADQCVTLSTIYKAKGNEAYVVYIVGIDALFHDPTPKNRNRAFTAMTRAKGWLHVTGLGKAVADFASEIAAAKQNYPLLKFVYPSEQQLVYMKRDLITIDAEEADETLTRLANEMEPEDLEYLLKKKLRELRGKKRPAKKMD